MKKLLYIALFLSLILPSISSASFDVNLKYGSKGEAVKELQDFLIDQGYLTGQSNGSFFSLTLKAVKAFQGANNLPKSGYFGMASRAKANEILVADLNTSDDAEKADTGSVVAPVKTITQDTQALIDKVDKLQTWVDTQTKPKQTVIEPTVPTQIDECPNIEGVQKFVPKSMRIDIDGSCVSRDGSGGNRNASS